MDGEVYSAVLAAGWQGALLPPWGLSVLKQNSRLLAQLPCRAGARWVCCSANCLFWWRGGGGGSAMRHYKN